MNFVELMTPLTPSQWRSNMLGLLEKIGVNTSCWKSGSIVRTFITACSYAFSTLQEHTVAIAKMGFLSTSTGGWLRDKAYYDYGITALEQTAATGSVTITNAGGGVWNNLAPGDIIVANARTGKTYRNTSTVSILSGLPNARTYSIDVEATELGSGSNALPGEITEFETVFNGCTVTNTASIEGTDVESDDSIRMRCNEAASSISPNGPRDAYAAQARSVISGCRVRVVSDGAGGVTMIIADSDGGATSSQVAAVQALVNTNAVPFGVGCTVVAGELYAANVAYELWIRASSGATISQIQTAVLAALADFAATVPIGGVQVLAGGGGYLYYDQVAAVIARAHPDILHATVTIGGGTSNLALSDNQVVYFGANYVTCTLHSVANYG
jgi:hypothetical protein